MKVTVSGVPYANLGVYTAADGTFIVEGVPEKASVSFGMVQDQPYLPNPEAALAVEIR